MGTLVFQANLGGAVNLVGPNTASTVNFTLPSADGTNGQALVTNGTGTLSFSTVSGTPGGSNTQVQFNNSGAFGGSANLTFNGTTLTAAGLAGPFNGTVGATTQNTGYFTTMRLYGSGSGYVGLQGAAAAGSTTYTLPAADGTNGQSLTTNGSGTLSWASSSGGGFSGATVTTSAVDITLTSASTQTQAISMTAAGKFVNLPSATTLSTKGGAIFIIQNKGQNPFGIKDASGNVVTPMLYYGQSVSLVLLANATTAGSWGALAIGSAGLVATGPVNVSTSLVANSAYVRVAGLSSTQALIAYYNTAGLNTQVMLATISGTTVTFGSPTTLLASSNTILGCVGLSSSLAVFLVLNGSSVLQAVAVSVSGSTLTVGTAAAVTAVGRCAGISENVLADTSTSGVVTFGTDNGSTVALTTRGFTVAGTTITFGTAQNLVSVATGGSGAAAYLAAVKLATGSYVSIFYSANSTLAYAQPFTLSGNTVTLGTQTTYSSSTLLMGIIQTAAQPGGGYAASSTCGVFSYTGYSVSVNISGTTISSVAPTYNGPVTYDANVAVLGYSQPFGTTGALTSDIYGAVTAYTGSSNGFGGTAPIVFANMQYTSNAYLDATTNIVAGIFGTGYVGAVVVKGN